MTRTLYRDLFGAQFDTLPVAIREMHGAARRAEGRAEVIRGASIFARLICVLSGAPKAGVDIPVTVTFDPVSGGECWTRDFNGDRFQTKLCVRKRAPEPEAVERFGPLWFRMRMTASENGVDLVPIGVSFLGLPLPRFMCPHAGGTERVKEGQFHFDVWMKFFMIGEVVRYRGWLAPIV